MVKIMRWKENVLNLLQQKGWTQKELAKASKINESSVSRYLKSNQEPRVDVLVSFAKALDVSLEYLVGEECANENAYTSIANAIARNGNQLTTEEQTKLISLILEASKR